MIPHVLAMALTVAPVLGAPTAVPAQADAAPRRVALKIDHAPLLEHQDAAAAEETATFLRQDAVGALQQAHGVDVVEDGSAPAIVVELSWVDYGRSVYRITVVTQRPGQDARLLESYDCECIDSGVIESVLQRLPRALEQLDEPTPPAEPAATEASTTERAGTEPATAEPEGQPEGKAATGAPIGALGIAGIVVAAGGVGALGFGISRLAKGQERTADPQDEERTQTRDFRSQGRAWLGLGLGAAALGTAMLVVDLTVLRRRRAAPVALRPAVGPAMTGLQLYGRF
ncbi:MAG: hypothetical protein AB1Z98_28430 [Nannocystaceae bacterium]